MPVRIQPLASGSQGNATLVELGSTRLLVEAGVPARTLARRLEAVGIAPSTIGFILLSHEHHDHCCGAERFSVRHGVPVVCGRETLEAMNLSPVHLAKWHTLEHGQVLDLGEVRVDAFPVPHDAARPVGFVLEGAGVRVGIVTDLGHATTLVVERLKGCDILVVESNHDDQMLMGGAYPWHLKQRVGGRMGHLSNDEAAELLRRVVGSGCRAVVLAHLSEKNNTPTLALAAASRVLNRGLFRQIELHVARTRGLDEAVVL